MRSVALLRIFVLVLALACSPRGYSQPAQGYVASIGSSPLTAPATADFTPSETFTMEGWFYLTADAYYPWLMGKTASFEVQPDKFYSFALQLSLGNKPLFVCAGSTTNSYSQVEAPTGIPVQTWTHLAAVLDHGAMRLFVNGSLVASGSSVGNPAAENATPFSIGVGYRADGSAYGSPFPGYARQVRFWNVARTGAQLLASLNESLPSPAAGLVAAWPLDESGGTTARDVSGAGRSLTVARGSLVAIRTAVVSAPQFFSSSAVPVSDGSLNDLEGAALIDFDNDGDNDVVLWQYAPPSANGTPSRLRAFRNTNGGLSDVTDAVLGNVSLIAASAAYAGDFNGDGRADLLVVGGGNDLPPFPGEQSRLFIQSADGRLVDETVARLPQHRSFTHNVAVADIDGDGDLDIYMCNIFGGDAGVGPRIYVNNGAGVFSEPAGRIPTDIATRAVGSVYTACIFVDLNGDGRPELVLGGGAGGLKNEALINDGSGTFTRNSSYTLPAKLFSTESVVTWISKADFNGDGAPDLLLATTGGSIVASGITIYGYALPGLQLLLNRGDGTFYDATSSAGFTWGSTEQWMKNMQVADLDGDGRSDIVGLVLRSDGWGFRNFLCRGAGQFVEATDVYSTTGARLVLTADFDRDGKTDVLTASSYSVTVARSLGTLSRTYFQAVADEAGRLVNISVRANAGTGDQTLIAGFVVNGAGSKALLVRAIGPALAAFGVNGALSDSMIEVAPQGAAKVAENDNWGGTPALKSIFNTVGAFALTNDASKDAALAFSPAAGTYSAKVTGGGGTTGVALVEIYDADVTSASRLVNISTRTQVGTGGDVLIAGFVVNGNVPKRFLIRAVGPTLATYGVAGALIDPVLEVRAQGLDNVLATNDDWRGSATLKALFSTVGAFSFGSDSSKDAAIAVELPPGVYSATVQGKNSTTGVALVEIYELP